MSETSSEGAWQVWYQDVFDREAPRRVETEGRGLVEGLMALWWLHLWEGVDEAGRSTFSRFNLWLVAPGRSVRLADSPEGAARLRAWVFAGGEAPDRALLAQVARAHARRMGEDPEGEGILLAAARAEDRAAFEAWLASEGGVSPREAGASA